MTLSEQDTHPHVYDIRLVALTQGQFAQVSPHRCDEVTRLKWYAARGSHTKPFYAVRSVRINKGDGEIEIRRVSLARFLLGLADDDPRVADHINGHTLDNRDENLRAIPEEGNIRNRRRQCNNTSGFKGVSKHNGSSKWVAYIAVNGKNIYLGLYSTPQLAYEAYCRAAIKYHGECARLE